MIFNRLVINSFTQFKNIFYIYNTLNYIFLGTASSTNDVAKERIHKHNGNHGLVIQSAFQVEGRGRQDNVWESEDGKNLLVSFVVEPTQFLPSQQFIINQLISTVVCDFVQEKTKSKNVTIKWPNDIYVENRKIAGILIENIILGEKMTHCIIGIGLNVNQIEFKNAPNPISLKQITHQNYDIKIVAHELAEKFFSKFDLFDFEQLNPLRNHYTKSLYQYNKKQRFSIDNKELNAIILGVTDCGMLRLGFNDGTENIYELNSIKYLI